VLLPAVGRRLVRINGAASASGPPLKTNLDHLPDGKRLELTRVLEVLFREFGGGGKDQPALPASQVA
jgi:hypothetical protein